MPQGAPEQYELNDDQLRQLLADPLFGPQHVQKMSPSEQQRLAAMKAESQGPQGAAPPGRLERASGTIKDLLVGALKEGGQTAQGIRDIPGRLAAGAMGEPFVPADTSNLEPSNTTQRVGGFGENLAEYTLGGGIARKGLTRLLAPTAGASAIKTRLMGSLGRSASEGVGATAVAGLHGDPTPEGEGLTAGTLTGIREAAQVLGPLLRFPLVQHIATTAIVSSAASGAGTVGGLAGVGGVGIGASMGGYNAVRRILANIGQKAAKHPLKAPATTPMTGMVSRTAAALTEDEP